MHEEGKDDSVKDKYLFGNLSKLEKETLAKFLTLETGDRRNIRVYLDQRIDRILERYKLREEEEEGN